jgi:hypothetical protein
MFIVMNRFQVRAGRADAFLERWQDVRERARFEGMVSFSLLRNGQTRPAPVHLPLGSLPRRVDAWHRADVPICDHLDVEDDLLAATPRLALRGQRLVVSISSITAATVSAGTSLRTLVRPMSSSGTSAPATTFLSASAADAGAVDGRRRLRAAGALRELRPTPPAASGSSAARSPPPRPYRRCRLAVQEVL